MNTSLSHLRPHKRQQLHTIIQLIKKAAHPEIIILFGIYAAGDDITLPPHIAAYDLLVITRPGDPLHDYQLQDMIENRCQSTIPTTVIVHDIVYMNKSLSEGHPFFCEILTDGILLHQGGSAKLTEPPQPDLARIAGTAHADWRRWSGQAHAFLKSAIFNQQREERKLAVFLLHQAAECAYQAILLVFTGYKPCTHNLDKLRRYTNRLSIELAALFPRNSPEENDLFKLLLHAYTDARYKEEYSISDEQLFLLLQRVTRLHAIAERICRNHFISHEKRAAMAACHA